MSPSRFLLRRSNIVHYSIDICMIPADIDMVPFWYLHLAFNFVKWTSVVNLSWLLMRWATPTLPHKSRLAREKLLRWRHQHRPIQAGSHSSFLHAQGILLVLRIVALRFWRRYDRILCFLHRLSCCWACSTVSNFQHHVDAVQFLQELCVSICAWFGRLLCSGQFTRYVFRRRLLLFFLLLLLAEQEFPFTCWF
jgi:hypothetical protein